MSTRVVLADDHRIVREGLRSLLQEESDFEVVGEASDGQGALALARQLRPDVLVADVSMPGLNGIELVRRLRCELPEVRVLSLSVHDEERLVLAMIEAGACGYLIKDSSFHELATGIREAMAGRIHLSPSLVGIFVQQYRAHAGGVRGPQARLPASAGDETPPTPPAPAPAGGPRAGGAALTPRERELVQLFSEGYSTAEIAERLHISAKTVATHRENILGKLGIHGIAEMTRYALREGISSLEMPLRHRG